MILPGIFCFFTSASIGNGTLLDWFHGFFFLVSWLVFTGFVACGLVLIGGYTSDLNHVSKFSFENGIASVIQWVNHDIFPMILPTQRPLGPQPRRPWDGRRVVASGL